VKKQRIAHVDMDAFYAAVEVRNDPSLRGKPVVVGGAADQRGVVSAASYEARRYGIHSAMPMAEAVRRCPDLVRVAVHGDRYSTASRDVMAVLRRYSPTLEPLSLDEAFLDLSGTERSLGRSIDIGRHIKAEILEATGLVASVGIAPVKFVAKIASDLEKPDGLVVVEEGEVSRFLAPLPIRRLWGIGPKMQEKLLAHGLRTIGDIAGAERRLLEMRFGRSGTHILDLAQGRDDRRVIADHDAKSYSHEVTFAVDQTDGEQLRAVLLSHASRVARRLRNDSVWGRTITLKLRDHAFHTRTHRLTREDLTDDAMTIYRAGDHLLSEIWDGRPIRLIGLGVSGISSRDVEPLSLFEDTDRVEKRRKLVETIDKIEDRFGNESVFRAKTLESKETPDTGSSLAPEE